MLFHSRISIFRVNSNYKLYKQSITRVDVIKDLGVYFSKNLSFAHHINCTIKRAHQLVGFIKRTCCDFTNTTAIKSIYIALVRSILEYCSVVWSPHQKSSIDRIERVQRKFIKFLCFKEGMEYNADNYLNLCSHFKLSPLFIRRQVLDLCFIHKCVNYITDCPDINSSFTFFVPPRRLRSSDLFRIPNHRVNLSKYCFSSRAMSLLNSVYRFDIDLFTSLSAFKTQVSSVLLSFVDSNFTTESF